MGQQVALEAYLRAMVNEWDETGILQKGADQGFHNYLYYTNKLRNVAAIHSIRVFPQGRGIINNLGALRKLALTDLGVYDNVTKTVLNWDGTLSPVVHQWDRDKELFHYMVEERLPQYEREWKGPEVVAQESAEALARKRQRQRERQREKRRKRMQERQD